MVVDVDGGGDVHWRDEAEPVVDTAAAHDLLDLGCDVDHLVALASVKGEVFGVGFGLRHGFGSRR